MSTRLVEMIGGDPGTAADEAPFSAEELFLAGFNLPQHDDEFAKLLALSDAEPAVESHSDLPLPIVADRQEPVQSDERDAFARAASGSLDPSYDELYATAPDLSYPENVVDERDTELLDLRDRMAYYSAFDALIRDNIQRSAELFQSLYDERQRIKLDAEQTRAEIEAAATLEADRRLGAERQRFQSMLMAVMDEASRMQRQVDGLIQRIAEAITETSR